MATLKNHSGFWLRDDAANAFNQAEDAHGVFSVNSAGRTEAEQQGLINRWAKGGAANRPPYLYRPASPASTSNHVDNGGEAIDLGDWRRFATICEQFGFRHTYPEGDPVHFDFIGTVATSVGNFDQDTKNRQDFLNSRGWSLVPDGLEGPLSRKAYGEYQTYLQSRGWYSGAIDGIWGAGTQAGHELFWAELNAPAPAAPQYHTATPADIASLGDSRGIQKVAKLNGYTGELDNQFGGGSQAGLQNFLNRNYGGSLAAWLRAKWGYSGNDQWGPIMSSAADRANAANWRAL